MIPTTGIMFKSVSLMPWETSPFLEGNPQIFQLAICKYLETSTVIDGHLSWSAVIILCYVPHVPLGTQKELTIIIPL